MAFAASRGLGSAPSTVSENSFTITASENTDRAHEPANAPIPTAVTRSFAQNRSGTARTTFMTDRLTTMVVRLGLVSGDMAKARGRARPQPTRVATTAIWKVSRRGSSTLCQSSTQSHGTGQNFSHRGFDQTFQNVEMSNPTWRPANTV